MFIYAFPNSTVPILWIRVQYNTEDTAPPPPCPDLTAILAIQPLPGKIATQELSHRRAPLAQTQHVHAQTHPCGWRPARAPPHTHTQIQEIRTKPQMMCSQKKNAPINSNQSVIHSLIPYSSKTATSAAESAVTAAAPSHAVLEQDEYNMKTNTPPTRAPRMHQTVDRYICKKKYHWMYKRGELSCAGACACICARTASASKMINLGK